MKFPDIKLGKSTPSKNHFPLPIDCNTTADWGFVQPLCKVALIPNSDINIKLNSFVRLASMNVPTFGRVEYRTYHRFVPIADLWQPFEAMLLGKPYHTSALTGIPTSVPVVKVSDLSAFLLICFDNIFTVYKAQRITEGENIASSYVPVSNTELTAAITWFNEYKNAMYENQLSINGNCATNQNDLPGSAFSGSIFNITPNNADVIVTGKPSNTSSYMFCFRLNQKARNLRKVLIGLGYQFDLDNIEPVSLLPIFAYFKAYYDLFAPQRETTWTSTNAFRVLDYWRENFTRTTTQDSLSSLSNKNSLLSQFLYDCSECYYTEDPNFVSAHIATPSITNSSNVVPYNSGNALEMQSNVYSTQNNLPSITQVGSGNTLTSVRLKLLERLTPYVNKFTSAGGKFRDLLKSIFGADYIMDDRSYHIGSNVLQCQISDVYSTTENSDVALGEYAGKGIGFDEGQKFEYHTKTFGYYIALGAMVPNSAFAQGIDPNLKHRTKFEFYNGAFDALGFQITEKSSIYGSNDVSLNKEVGTSGSFGFIPRYSEYKTAQNILNGMMSLRSTRYSYLPYTLDKYITPTNLVGIPVDNNGKIEGDDGFDEKNIVSYTMKYVEHSIPIASSAWRYIGKYQWLGNFNRIFNNEGYEDANPTKTRANTLSANDRYIYDPIEDNFIIHNLFDIHVNANMLSMADSFDTDSFDNDAISTEKA